MQQDMWLSLLVSKGKKAEFPPELFDINEQGSSAESKSLLSSVDNCTLSEVGHTRGIEEL